MKDLRKWTLILGLFLGWIFPGGAMADDMSIFDIDASIRPDVLIIFDNSTSMRYFLPYDDAVDYGDATPGTGYDTPGPFQNKDSAQQPVIYYQAGCYDLYCGPGGGGDPPCLPGRECSIFDLFDPQSLWARFWVSEAHAAQSFLQCTANDWIHCRTCDPNQIDGRPVKDCMSIPYHKYTCTPERQDTWTCYDRACSCRYDEIVINGATFQFARYHYEIYAIPGTPENPKFIDVNLDGQDDRINPTNEDIIRRYKGNYLNYIHRVKTQHPKVVVQRYTAAKTAIQSVITNYYSRVNFGLMVFDKIGDTASCSDGGKVVVEISNPSGDDAQAQMENKKLELITALDSSAAQPQDGMFTPLAEALADAGRYFRGLAMDSNTPHPWSASGAKKKSPVKEYCQGCYVIMVTDGEPTCDADRAILETFLPNEGGTNYMTVEPSTPPIVRDPDKITYRWNPGNPHPVLGYQRPDDEKENNDNKKYLHFLDNVALYLYEKDMCVEAGAKDSDPNKGVPGCKTRDQEGRWPIINIKTYVIGFGVGNEILRSAAFWGTGGRANLAARQDGEGFFRAGTEVSLEKAFDKILNEILQKPLITTNVGVSTGEVTSGDSLYVPTSIMVEKTGGDLRKYSIDGVQIKGRDGALATDATGRLLNNFYWSASAQIKAQVTAGTRNIYTNVQAGTADITHANNVFAASNNLLTRQKLGNPPEHGSGNREDIIDYIRGLNIDSSSTPRPARNYVLGSILHSSPLAVNYPSGTPNRVVYVGANEGMLHAINDTNGQEMWAFIPEELLGKLKDLVSTNVRQYFVDGSPKVVTLNITGTGASRVVKIVDPDDPAVTQRILVFGFRKGGRHYYGLDITNAANPKILWKISPSGDFDKLGETWSEPMFGMVKGSGGNDVVVGFIGGGYDPNHNESRDHNDGNGVYAFNVLDGTKVYSFSGRHGGGDKKYSTMKYSIPSNVLAYDSDNDGYIDRIYVGDVGGQLWVITDQTTWSPQISQWTAQVLFDSRGGSTLASEKRRIFSPPDLVRAEGKFFLYFGTGDREDPREKTVVNRFYLVKDPWTSLTSALTESDLLNVTTTLNPASSDLASNKGWYFKLGPDAPADPPTAPDGRTGEKVLSRAKVYASRVYFTSFAPTTGRCEVGGTPRFYTVNYLNATPYNIDYYEPTPAPPEKSLTLADRSKVLEALGGIPADPLIVTSQSADSGLTAQTYGISGPGVPKVDDPPTFKSLIPYSWRDKGASPGVP